MRRIHWYTAKNQQYEVIKDKVKCIARAVASMYSWGGVGQKFRHVLKPGRWTGRWTMDAGRWTLDDGRPSSRL